MNKSTWTFYTAIIAIAFAAFACTNNNNAAIGSAPKSKETVSKAVAVAYDNTFVNAFDKQLNFELFYDIDSRFKATISKEKLHQAKSIVDILPEKATQQIESCQLVEVEIYKGEKQKGRSSELNEAQLKLLQSADYSTDICIKANYKTKNAHTGELESEYLSYYITVVPEKEAEFTSGQDALMDYLKENSKKETAIITKDKLKAGRVNFTVTKNGTVSNVQLTSTSGYPTVDTTLVELIQNMPQNWTPATNSKGEKVEQEFVFFFGMEGC